MPIWSSAPEAEGRSVTLHSTWIGIVMSYLGALLFVVFSSSLLAVSGPSAISIGLFVVSLAFAGVVRRTALRHHFIPWDDVTRLRRLRVGVLRTRKDARGGGLVAKVNGRNSVLVDTMESALEFDELERLLGEQGDALGLNDAIRPPDGRSPTWLYHKDRWKPESARSR